MQRRRGVAPERWAKVVGVATQASLAARADLRWVTSVAAAPGRRDEVEVFTAHRAADDVMYVPCTKGGQSKPLRNLPKMRSPRGNRIARRPDSQVCIHSQSGKRQWLERRSKRRHVTSHLATTAGRHRHKRSRRGAVDLFRVNPKLAQRLAIGRASLGEVAIALEAAQRRRGPLVETTCDLLEVTLRLEGLLEAAYRSWVPLGVGGWCTSRAARSGPRSRRCRAGRAPR